MGPDDVDEKRPPAQLSFVQNLVANVFIAIFCAVAICVGLAIAGVVLLEAGILFRAVLRSAGLVDS